MSDWLMKVCRQYVLWAENITVTYNDREYCRLDFSKQKFQTTACTGSNITKLQESPDLPSLTEVSGKSQVHASGEHDCYEG